MNPDRMTNAQAVILCRFAKACCPQQAFDQYTPDAWFELLRDLRFEDCKAAVVRIVKAQPFVSPAEVRGAIKIVRAERLTDYERSHGRLVPPGHLADDPQGQLDWRRDAERRICDGEVTHPDQIPGVVLEVEAQPRDVSELGQAGRSATDALRAARAGAAEGRRLRAAQAAAEQQARDAAQAERERRRDAERDARHEAQKEAS